MTIAKPIRAIAISTASLFLADGGAAAVLPLCGRSPKLGFPAALTSTSRQ